MERIRDVRLQIICTQDIQLNAELNMESNCLFLGGDKYVDNRIGVQNLATSTAVLDCGKFDFDFKKEKFSPFEGAGIISSWRLFVTGSSELDPEKIKDVIVYLSYSARNA